MDDDARPSPGAVTRFRDAIRFYPQDQPVGVVLAAVRFPAGPICEMNRPWRNPYWHKSIFLRTVLGGGRQGFHINDADYAGAEPMPVDGGSFVGQFISAAAVDRCGYPDGRLFIYGDDVLYTLRIARAGFRNWFDPRVHWEHDFGTFDRAHQRAYYPLWKVAYNFRNGLMLYREAAGPVLFWGVLLLVVPKWRHYFNILKQANSYYISERKYYDTYGSDVWLMAFVAEWIRTRERLTRAKTIMNEWNDQTDSETDFLTLYHGDSSGAFVYGKLIKAAEY